LKDGLNAGEIRIAQCPKYATKAAHFSMGGEFWQKPHSLILPMAVLMKERGRFPSMTIVLPIAKNEARFKGEIFLITPEGGA
jgi:hypothetical protein